MAHFKNSRHYKKSYEEAQDAALTPDALKIQGNKEGHKDAQKFARESSGRTSAKDVALHLRSRRPDLFKKEDAAKVVEDAPSASNGVATA